MENQKQEASLQEATEYISGELGLEFRLQSMIRVNHCNLAGLSALMDLINV